MFSLARQGDSSGQSPHGQVLLSIGFDKNPTVAPISSKQLCKILRKKKSILSFESLVVPEKTRYTLMTSALRNPATIITKTLSPLFGIHMLSTCCVVSPQMSAGHIKYSSCSLEHQNLIEGARICKQMNSVLMGSHIESRGQQQPKEESQGTNRYQPARSWRVGSY